MRNIALVIGLIMVSACDVNINDNTSKNKTSGGSKVGACGSYDIVGTYEDGLEFTADCEFQFDGEALIFSEFSTEQITDPTFRNIQTFKVDSTETGEPEWCTANLYHDRLSLDCYTVDYTGYKQ